MGDKLRIFEAFAGYGSQSIALRNIGVDYEVVAISEIDKFAIQGYEAIHGKVNNLGDISKINVEDIPTHDLFTYSFPCQDISVAGKREGIVKGETRSGLLYECERIIEYCRPKYLLLENVKNLVSKKFKPQFDEWLEYLESLGYTNYWKVLNAKDYGVPQNRERVFVVSILGEHKPYEFPEPIKLELKLKDLLENNVEQKYNLKNTKDFFIKNSFNMEYKGNGFRFKPHIKNNADIAFSLTTRCGGRMDDNYIIDVDLPYKNFEYSIDFLKNNILSDLYHKRFLDNFNDKNIINKVPNGSEIKIIGTTQGDGKSANCRQWFYDINNVIGCLSVTDYKQPKQILDIINGNIVIRKLTPRECFRLMGLHDDDIDKIQGKGISNAQQYKMAGNSICIPVLEHIFKHLFIGDDKFE